MSFVFYPPFRSLQRPATPNECLLVSRLPAQHGVAVYGPQRAASHGLRDQILGSLPEPLRISGRLIEPLPEPGRVAPEASYVPEKSFRSHIDQNTVWLRKRLCGAGEACAKGSALLGEARLVSACVLRSPTFYGTHAFVRSWEGGVLAHLLEKVEERLVKVVSTKGRKT